MNAIWIAIKDLRLLVRDRVAVFWVLGFPLIFAVLFGEVIASASEQDERTSDLVVVDQAQTEASAKILKVLQDDERLDVVTADAAAAQSAVRRGSRLAYLVIPAQGGPLELGVDPTRTSEAAMLTGKISKAIAPPTPAGAGSPGIDLIRVGSNGSDGRSVAFPAALLWSLLACAATFAVSLAAEHASGTELRLRAAPISISSILGGKALACLLACLFGSALLAIAGRLILGIMPGSAVAVAAALFCASVCFVGLIFLLGSIGGSQQAVAGAGWATLIVFAMIGGAMVPLSALPDWLAPISHISPVKWGIVALEGAYFRSFSARELLQPCAVLLAMGAGAGLSGLALMSRRFSSGT